MTGLIPEHGSDSENADSAVFFLQGSGLPQRLQFALQAFVLYPLVLPIVELGYRGAKGDREECQAEALEARERVTEVKKRIQEELSTPISECCGLTKADAQRMLATADGRNLLEAALRNGTPCIPPPPAPSGPGVVIQVKEKKFWEEMSIWREHRDDESFINGCKALIRCIRTRRPLATSPIDADGELDDVHDAVRHLSTLEDLVIKAFEPRVRSIVTSPSAMMGTAGMWWAMLGHELAALCNFSTSVCSF